MTRADETMAGSLDRIFGEVDGGIPLADSAAAILRGNGKPQTAAHVMAVSLEAARLAERFGEDPRKAATAGLLHDISVVIPDEDRVEALRVMGFSPFPEELSLPMIAHQRLSGAIARKYFMVEDELVLGAISHHTTLRAEPTGLDMVVFLADKIAWDQPGEPAYLGALTAGLDISLEAGSANFISYLFDNRRSLRVVHPWLLEAFRYFEARAVRPGVAHAGAMDSGRH